MSEFTFWSIAALFAIIGWVGGMLFMRWQYFEKMRRDHRLINKLIRRAN